MNNTLHVEMDKAILGHETANFMHPFCLNSSLALNVEQWVVLSKLMHYVSTKHTNIIAALVKKYFLKNCRK